MKKAPIHLLTMLVILFVFCWLMIERAQADDLFGGESFFGSETSDSGNSQIWKSDGSLVIINGAEESGYVIKGDDSGNEIEYYVKPKDDGSPTFIYDDELIICTNTGCY
tara:strand:+ start:325 stop:651 length:327 start_codon:yes stop_codon:yes gene_type:complete